MLNQLNAELRDQFRHVLFSLGTRLSENAITRVDSALNRLATGSWAAARHYRDVPRFSSRERLFEHFAGVVAEKQTLYLEFGVWRGDSMRTFSRLLRHPGSHLHGFDSFEGLPENWRPGKDAGHFSTGGRLPEIDDPRVRFFKGWFDRTLPSYELPPHDQLIINVDADLYSSTQYVLNALQAHLTVGTIVYFDEFLVREHELRAFDEFLRATGMEFAVLGEARGWEHVAFRRVA